MKNKKGTSNLGSYYESLSTEIKLDDILLDLTHGFEELNQIIIPMFELNIDYKFQGNISKITDYRLKRDSSNFENNTFTTIYKLLLIIKANEDYIIDMVENNFDSIIIKYNLDYRKLNILKYIESLNYINEFSRRWLMAISVEEFDNKTNKELFTAVAKADTTFVKDNNNLLSFIQALDLTYTNIGDFLKSIKDLEGHVFDIDDHEATKGVTGRKLDPHQFGLFPVRWNPIYHIGLIINDWRVARHNRKY